MRSRLYRGTVRHRRMAPLQYDFRHGVSYLGVDLDELDVLDRSLRLLSVEGRNLFRLLAADHYTHGTPGSGLADSLRTRLAGQGLPAQTWRIELITYPRTAGHVFNPVSFYLCRDASTDVVRHVVAEVHNRHGERHLYDLAAEDRAGATYRAQCAKAFYVSPFMPADTRYTFHLAEQAEEEHSHLLLAVNAATASGPMLHTGLRLRTEPLSDRALARAFLAAPFLTLKTVGLIHWHALRLWSRGMTYRGYRPGKIAR